MKRIRFFLPRRVSNMQQGDFMDQAMIEKVQQKAAQILADIIGKEYGVELTVHVERTDNNG